MNIVGWFLTATLASREASSLRLYVLGNFACSSCNDTTNLALWVYKPILMQKTNFISITLRIDNKGRAQAHTRSLPN